MDVLTRHTELLKTGISDAAAAVLVLAETMQTRKKKAETPEPSDELVWEFVEEKCHHIPGAKISFKEFYRRFSLWLPPRTEFSRFRVAALLPKRLQYGAHNCSVRTIGNLSFEPGEQPGPPLIAVSGRLRRARGTEEIRLVMGDAFGKA